ncbi:MAG: DUF1102 domain-containing protein, partial [archaeon]
MAGPKRRWKLLVLLLAFGLVSVAAGMSIMSAPGQDIINVEDTDVIQLEPYEQQNGSYAVINDTSGEIEIRLSSDHPDGPGEGVNPSAFTDIGPVFTVENVINESEVNTTVQGTTGTVWIDHELRGEGIVEFYTLEHGDIEADADNETAGRAVGVNISPGESFTVGMTVDTRGLDVSNGDSIDLDEFTIVALFEEYEVTATPTPSPTPTPTSTPEATPTPTPEDTP